MNNKSSEERREKAGRRSGIMGLMGNLMLAVIKAAAGVMSNSVAVTADAMNNLTDCASSLVTLLAFTLSSREKDKVHPYGHGRMEYICGFVISLLIMYTGVSIGLDSGKRLFIPQDITITGVTIAVLGIGIAVKACMAWCIYRWNKNVDSAALRAVLKDNLLDAAATAVTLAGILAAPYTSLPVDGIHGIAVSAFILKSGFNSFRENFVLLLGEGIDSVTEDGIRQIVSQYIPAKAVEEISLHDYGPESRLVYIKIEFPPAYKVNYVSELLSCIGKRIEQELQLDAAFILGTPQTAE